MSIDLTPHLLINESDYISPKMLKTASYKILIYKQMNCLLNDDHVQIWSRLQTLPNVF